FGIVRVGDAAPSLDVSVTNAAATAALNDALQAAFGTVTGPFHGSGLVSGLVAGASNASGSLSVGLDTSTAGVFSGSAALAFASQNPELADLLLAGDSVLLQAQVNNLANPVFAQLSGRGTLTL